MAFGIIYTIRDAKGKDSTMQVNVPGTLNLIAVSNFAAQVASLIDPLITGRIVRIGVALQITLPAGLADTIPTNSDVEEGARFQFRTNGGFYTGFRIPTFDETLMVAGTDQVNLTNALVQDFVDALTTGILVGDGDGPPSLVQAVDQRDDPIDVLEFAREQFISTRRRA